MQLSNKDTIVIRQGKGRFSYCRAGLACLKSLSGLHEACIESADGPILLEGLAEVSQLKALHLIEALPGTVPPELIELSLWGIEEVKGGLHEAFRQAPATWECPGLGSVTLPMYLFQDEPLLLANVSCLKNAHDLHLRFRPRDPDWSLSGWPARVFSQLRHIHIDVDLHSSQFEPIWDFSLCTGIERFSLAVDGDLSLLSLGSISHLETCIFRLAFGARCQMTERIHELDCASWTVAHAEVSHTHVVSSRESLEELPLYVVIALCALGYVKDGPPLFTVFSPFQLPIGVRLGPIIDEP